MNISERAVALAASAETRYRERSTVRETRLRQADRGNIWGADDPERVAKRLAHVQAVERAAAPRSAAELAATPGADRAVADVETLVTMLARERVIGRDDLVAPQFLKVALAAARCVCRITVRRSSGGLLGYGTGTLVGPGILLTNHHVLETADDAVQSEATFGLESGTTLATDERIVRFQPQRLFITDEALDFTFVAVAPVDARGTAIDDLGYIALNQAEGKAINGEYVNVIEHPNGGPKMFALRENRIVDVLTNYLHYAADTAPGSSGAPVFNDQYEVVALHHSGVPARDAQGRVLNRDGQPWTSDQGETQVQWIANEGIRVSVLVNRAKSLARTAEEQALLAKAFDVSHSVPRLEAVDARSGPLAATPSGPALSMAGNVATWTIPLSVSINLGGVPLDAQRAAASLAPPPALPAAVVPVTAAPPERSLELVRAIEHAREVFKSVPGVLRVRAGWQFADGWITDNPAIVVVVEEKKTTATLKEQGEPKLPVALDGFPVDVRQASAEELYELQRIGTAIALEERTAHPTYQEPPHLSLPRISEHMKLILHVSPEYGWPVLKEFLNATNEKLTVAMYDFGAPHIIEVVKNRLSSEHAKMQLVIQFGSSLDDGAKANDLDDADTVQDLRGALGERLAIQWANVAQKNSLWASAYHIKVAVRDSMSFWLSSGNWQSSNQAPDAPPADRDSAKTLLTDYNREWHVVVDNATLAKVFESYIKYDFDQSAGFVPKGAPEAFEILPVAELDPTEAAAEIRIFKPLEIDRTVDVQPVLTPDNYVDVVLPLIQGAQSKIYFQNQYINESVDERATTTYIAMLEALAEKQQQGVDVRIILRSDNGVEARHIEFMKTHGIDMTHVRWRRRTHTKGIIVDSARVLLGSHNWSFDGTVLNRDASLLFFDAEIAKYLEDVFIYDWENWSRSRVSIRQKKPTVNEVASAQDMRGLKERLASGAIRARRLFHPDD